jgi:hypothetical protein
LTQDSSLPYIDECRILILKMIEQAIRDYLSLRGSSAPIEQVYYHTACEFLFNDDYYIDYGGVDRNLEDLLDILDINITWFRERINKLKNKRIQDQREKRENYVIDEEDEINRILSRPDKLLD